MLKVLYACGNNSNALIQCSRFLKAMSGTSHTIKVAAYRRSSPNMSIDWTLDSLLNIFKPDTISLDNENFNIYFEQVKHYAPDLIICDAEYFTSYIANTLNITLWQCSSSLINTAIENKEKYNLGLHKQYSFLLGNNNAIRHQRQVNIIDNSNCNFVYSHFGDTENPPTLKNGFEWIRPYHSVGKEAITCKHNVVAGTLNNKTIYNILKKYPDSVAFTTFCDEQYNNFLLKDIDNDEEYFCNLKNSNLFVCEGQTSFLADAFYNNKFSIVFPNYKDIECIMNSIFSEHLGLSKSISETNEDLNKFMNKDIVSNYNKDIQYLHDRINSL